MRGSQPKTGFSKERTTHLLKEFAVSRDLHGPTAVVVRSGCVGGWRGICALVFVKMLKKLFESVLQSPASVKTKDAPCTTREYKGVVIS